MSAELDVELPVFEVTLMEDRARVLRRGEVELPAGLSRLRVEGAAPVLVDKTLAARCDTGAMVHDASVHRRRLVRPEDRVGEVRRLDEEIEETSDRLRAERARLDRVVEALGLIDEAAERTLAEFRTEAAWCRADTAQWETQLSSLTSREDALRDERLAIAEEIGEIQRSLQRLQLRRASLITPSDALRTTLHIDVEAEAAGSHAVEVEYLVPNACWRPHHRASVTGGRLRFESEGCVWQRTGEDWAGVRVRFSTQRPSLGGEPPRLTSDSLRVRRKSQEIVVEQRQQAIETTGLGAAAAAVEPELPGIDDGGEVQELVARFPATVPSDGRPHRVPLFEFDAETQETLTCAPELTLAVLRRTAQTNEATHPLLAGPVDLVREGGFIGRTTLLYIAPGERFELGWGPDPALRVHRSTEESDEKTNLLRSWQSVTRTVTCRLSNLGPDVARVELVERVPVSELEKVKIEVDRDETRDGATPDADGFVRWTLTLEGFARARADLRYVLRRHVDVAGEI